LESIPGDCAIGITPQSKHSCGLWAFCRADYFDIEGKLTDLKGKAMTSPCGKIHSPINESSHDKSQTAETLDLFHGEGIQYIAPGQRRHLHHRGWHEATWGAVSGHHQGPRRPGGQTPARAW